MKKSIFALAIAGAAAMPLLAQPGGQNAAPKVHSVHGELILYKQPNYNGDRQMISQPRASVHTDWNIRSISLHPGDRWQICARPRFRECIVLDRSLPDASVVGIEGQIGSARLAPEVTGAAQSPN